MKTKGCRKCDGKADCRKVKQIECYACSSPCPMDGIACSCPAVNEVGYVLPFGGPQSRNIVDFMMLQFM